MNINIDLDDPLLEGPYGIECLAIQDTIAWSLRDIKKAKAFKTAPWAKEIQEIQDLADQQIRNAEQVLKNCEKEYRRLMGMHRRWEETK